MACQWEWGPHAYGHSFWNGSLPSRPFWTMKHWTKERTRIWANCSERTWGDKWGGHRGWMPQNKHKRIDGGMDWNEPKGKDTWGQNMEGECIRTNALRQMVFSIHFRIHSGQHAVMSKIQRSDFFFQPLAGPLLYPLFGIPILPHPWLHIYILFLLMKPFKCIQTPSECKSNTLNVNMVFGPCSHSVLRKSRAFTFAFVKKGGWTGLNWTLATLDPLYYCIIIIKCSQIWKVLAKKNTKEIW